ncbi:MAG: SNF2-related protein [Bacteroidales bacterium]|nr:SNF2-related protein [Bacteroidales bacterium]
MELEGFKTIDNTNERVGDDLKQRLTKNSRLSIVAASFSIYAFEALKKELEDIEELRFIFSSPTFVKENIRKEQREFYIPKLNRERNLYGTDFEIRLRNQLSQKAIAKECADWIRTKVKFKSNISNSKMQGFIHILDDPAYAYYPFNDFTTSELGYENSDNAYTMINGISSSATEKYIKTFDEIWDDEKKVAEVTENVLEYVDNVYSENSPEYLYFIALYNIFNEFLNDISEDVLPNELTGFQHSAIWKILYKFQQDAALAIINKLERYNGCILADSVGLGKTFTALAVIKYYENRNKSVLVLCPKKLNENWLTFKSNYKNNPIAEDRLRYDIFFHTDLSRDGGRTNGQDLELINWGNYDLVVIDESHNFRNGGKVDEDEEIEDNEEGTRRKNRYQRLMKKVIRAGVKTKVLMLSATPVNNRFNDLRNQMLLAYEGDSDRMDEVLGFDKSVDDIFRNAQAAYNEWSRLETSQRTTQALLDRLSFDFFKMLDAVTIARSRKHIVNFYDTSEIGQFPKRRKPISHRTKLTDLENVIGFSEIAGMLNKMNLSIYTPSIYLQPSAIGKYKIDFEGSGTLSIAGREKGLRKLMAINLLKRLESSVESFRLTIDRILQYIVETISTIEKCEKSSVFAEFGDIDVEGLDLDSFDSEDEIFVTKQAKINISDIDTISWKRDLEADKKILDELMSELKAITPVHDSKLQSLYDELKYKIEHPINGNNKKVLIFTAFADTADYLYESLAERVKNDFGLNVALITGSTNGKCTIPKFPLNFNNVLTYFSPISKDRDKIFPNAKEDIDILIATDCISEGQNLQDCDYLINYDIHWNPVRIIQRFGRIDRIGSKNAEIQLVNYWPDMELDDYINLKGRVENRMKAVSLVATGDEDLLSNNEKGDLEYRRNQLRRLQEEVVDMEDMDTGVNIMDLGLNEFRLDLLAYMKEHPDVEHAPFGMNAVVASTDMAKPGVIYILKNRNNALNIDRKNLLHPFYMVYMADDGEVVCDYLHPKQLLDIMRLTCKGKNEYDKKLCALINKETKDGRKMEKYSALLQKAVKSIINLKEESDIRSLFSEGKTTASWGQIRGLNDFELICFLIIK